MLFIKYLIDINNTWQFTGSYIYLNKAVSTKNNFERKSKAFCTQLLNKSKLNTDNFFLQIYVFRVVFSVPGLQLANKMFLVFSEYPNFIYFQWIILSQSVIFFLLLGIWLWDRVIISNLMHRVCKSDVLVLFSSKFDWTKVGLGNSVLKLELLLTPYEHFQYTC